MFVIDTKTLFEYAAFMKSNELKELRNGIEVRQKDLAEILHVPFRTYQNWEQAEGKREHRKIPEEVAEKVRVLADYKKDSGGGLFPKNLAWLQIPLKPEELNDLQLRAELEEKTLSMLIREKIFEVLQSPLL